MKRCLLIVDVQNDFCPGGNLAVNDGDKIVPIINELIASGKFDVIVATQDWHPKNHCSFASRSSARVGYPQMLWPDHCVQLSKGAEIHAGLTMSNVQAIIRKGMNPEIDSYSAFADNAQGYMTGLMGLLTDQCVDEIYVCGLATDYCVKATAIDAMDFGEDSGIEAIYVIEDACRGVAPDTTEKALEDMKKSGINILKSSEVK